MKKNTLLFLIIILFFLFATIVSLLLSSDQQTKNRLNDEKFQNALSTIKSSPLQSIELLNELNDNQPKNETIYKYLATAYENTSDYRSALYYCKEAIKIRPSLIEDYSFVYHYGIVAVLNKEKSLALECFRQAKKVRFDNKDLKTIDAYIENLEKEMERGE